MGVPEIGTHSIRMEPVNGRCRGRQIRNLKTPRGPRHRLFIRFDLLSRIDKIKVRQFVNAVSLQRQLIELCKIARSERVSNRSA